MSAFIDVTITCKVWDAQALWDKAKAHYNIDSGGGDVDVSDVLGTRDAPDVGACLVMLLDRSEHLDGADIEESTTDWDWVEEHTDGAE